MTREDLAERVFARIEKLGIEPRAANMFLTAINLWHEDREKISKGFARQPGEEQEPARSSRHDIDGTNGA